MTGALIPLDATVGPLTWLPHPLQKAMFGDKVSVATREAYMRDGWHWVSWCREHGVNPLTATPGAARAWIDDQRTGAWHPPQVRRRGTGADSEATIARRVSSLSRLYAVLRGEGQTTADPLANVTRPKVVQSERRVLGLDARTARRLLAAADAHSPRMAALVWLLTEVGLRISEALGADVDALGEERGHRTITVVGKGRKERIVTIPPDAWHRLATYLAGRAEGPLFLAEGSELKRWDRTDAYRALRRLGRRSRIDLRLHPHKLRHTNGTLAADAGESIDRIAANLGHANLNTTRIYLAARDRVDLSSNYGVGRLLAETPLTDEPEEQRS